MKKYIVLFVIGFMFLLMGCQSAMKEEKSYQLGIELIDGKSYPKAIAVLSDLGDYKDSKELVSKLRYIINGDYIGAGNFLVAALKSDGTVIQVGGYQDSKSTGDWKNMISLSTHGEYLEGIDSNGEIVTTCPWLYQELIASSVSSAGAMGSVVLEIVDWKNVIAFQSDYPKNMIALLENGTVKVASSLMNENDIATTKTWKDIVAVSEGGNYVVALKAEGTVETAGENYGGNCDVTQWKDIVAISAAGNTIGLMEDGTVVATGLNQFGQCNVENWTDIISIATGELHTVGLKNDGRVITTGDNTFGQCDTDKWTDIVAIDASEYFTIGLKNDGTLVISGDGSYSGATTPNVENISDLFVPNI